MKPLGTRLSEEVLESLPVGSIIADLYDEKGDAPVVACKASDGDWADSTS